MAVLWLDGQLVDAGEARVSALDRGVVWGHGLFETLRAYRGRLWAFDAHFARLLEGAELMDIEILPPERLRRAIEDVLAANALEDAGARVTVTAGAGPVDPHADADRPPTTIVAAWPLRDYSRLYESGASLVTLPGWGRSPAGVKTTSYAASLAGRIAARRAGVDDALFVGPEGLVLETTGANVFAIFEDDLVTPPVSDAVLPGITRATVLGLAASVGLAPREEGLWLDDLFAADEVFATSTLREVYPVASVDGRALCRGDRTAAVHDAMRRHVAAVLEAG